MSKRAPLLMATVPPSTDAEMAMGYSMNNTGKWVLGFIVVAIIVGLVMYWIKPALILKKDAEGKPLVPKQINTTQLVIWSVLVTAIIMLIVWLFRGNKM